MEGGTANSMLGYVSKSGKFIRRSFCKSIWNLYFLQLRDLCCVRGPSQWSPLWGRQLRGLQGGKKSQFLTESHLNHALGVLQEVNEKGPGVQVQADKGLRCEQELSESVPVLPASKVPRHGHAQ